MATGLRSPGDLLERVRRDVERNALRARNGVKLVAGVSRPRLGQTPKDVFLLDWREADARQAGERLEDYADGYLPEAVHHTREAAGSDAVNLFGYCYGGVLSLLYAAHHPLPDAHGHRRA